ncbi:BRO family protein [Actinomyces procaprae]|uniref:BRO family protein n=1 Tax=Actinomyces procaprae TaxID=2560010 RepID=UPI0010A29903|nr:BRO family protein [Actinomyces procaprae]
MSGIITEADVPRGNNTEVFTYKFGDHGIRALLEGDEPWFVLADLCKALDLSNPSMVAKQVDVDALSNAEVIDSMGRTQYPVVVSEAGMYQVVFLSRKPEAKAFRRWVTREVLPSIRQRGGYLTPAAVERALTDPDFIIGLATSLKEERARRAALEVQVEEDRPHTRLGKALSASGGELLVKQVADAITQEGIPVNQAQLFRWLRSHGWLCNNRGTLWNAPTKWALERGYVRATATLVTTGHGDIEKTTPKITGPGQQVLIDGFTTGRFTLDDGKGAAA